MERGDQLTLSMLEVTEEETTTSPSSVEETRSLDKEPEPWKEQPTTIHASECLEEASLPEETGSSGMTIAWRWLPLTPLGFAEPLVGKSGLPPLEDDGSLLGIPQGAQLDLSSLGLMQVVIKQNTLKWEMWYQYQTRVISWMSLYLDLSDHLDQPNPHHKLKKPWVKWLLLNPQMNFKLSEYPFLKLGRT